MRFIAVLNRGGGTLRTMDLDAFESRMRDRLGEAGHTVEVRTVEGRDLMDALREAVAAPEADVVLAGGGDGTISAAASVVMDTGKALAVLPAGTMNLFARSLGMPLDLDSALAAFATGEIREVDVATANGRPFVHQYSVGLHAKLVKIRDQMKFSSRLGKMRASVRAAFATLIRPPSMVVSIDIDGAEIIVRASGIGVTNNLFGEGHLPYADHPDGGTLGVYVTTARRLPQLLSALAHMLVGRWNRNAHVEIHTGKEVVLKFNRLHRRHRCVIDGELSPIEHETAIRIHPKSLRVLVPHA
ncbi:diacylglycerol/lipid kinase family protein [Mesorhizobium australicum]|uniref:Diacylglycerol kinase family enzyme n=1 Tax=Mesorhizobium australicum TaxID=536018 RepID=A0A1X7PZU5_9HYPH|nr:diacylglycerol kinase family protein [Mesorhizobium australicum]SMH57053.1 Diacylglycerol kinase family enzyme [Mesorhizobium australicum]